MMCLGWANQTQCKNGRDQVQVEAPAAACDINWFWIAAAAIAGLGLMGRKEKGTTAKAA